MLIVPVAEKFSWKNPPWMTILFVLINIFVFTGLQGDDDKNWDKAIAHYFESGLGRIEIPLYLTFREAKEKPLTVPDRFKQNENDEQLFIFIEMEQDDAFQKQIQSESIVKKDSPDYETWKANRTEFQALKKTVFSNQYQFVPEEHRAVTFFSHMFLHGSFSHLFGNMLFLWLFGCILEIGCGRARYLLLYIVTGLGAVTLFWAFKPHSIIGLVGASGAISGLMGAYTVLFGKSRIKLFMYLGFYFNYLRLPAIALLPFWFFREVYSLFFGPPTNVAYTAHIGGIISGAIAGWLILKFSDFRKEDVFKEEEQDKSIPLVETALEHIGKLDFEKGKALLEEAITVNRANYGAWNHIYNIEKQNPESASFHSFIGRYLRSLCADNAMHDSIFDLYKDYRAISKPRLNPDLYISLCIIFAREGHLDEAESILSLILKKKPDLPKIPAALLRIAEAFKKNRLDDKSSVYMDILCQRYPETPEALLALKQISQ